MSIVRSIYLRISTSDGVKQRFRGCLSRGRDSGRKMDGQGVENFVPCVLVTEIEQKCSVRLPEIHGIGLLDTAFF